MTAIDVPGERTALAPVTLPRGGNPYWTYLAGLRSPETRRTMKGCLDRLALILMPGLSVTGHPDPGELVPWHQARYPDAAALNAVITARIEAGTKGAPGGWSPAHANKHITAWRRVIREAWRQHLMSAENRDRAADIAGVRSSRLPAGRHIRNEEITAMLSACTADGRTIGTRDAAVIAILWTTGGRRSEAAGARIEKYDTRERSLTLTGKGNKEREVYVNAAALPYIEAWITLTGSRGGPLLRPVDRWGHVAPRHMSTRAVGDVVDKCRRDAGLSKLTAHDYRRTFIGNMLEAGADIVTVQQIVGHANPATTAGYDRRSSRRRRAAVDLLSLKTAEGETAGDERVAAPCIDERAASDNDPRTG